MTTFALDDDWVEIDGDTYDDWEDQYGTPLEGRVRAELGDGIVRYYGVFGEEIDEEA